MQRKWKFNRKIGFFAEKFCNYRFLHPESAKFFYICENATMFFGTLKIFFAFRGKTLDFMRNAVIMKGKTERKGCVVPWDVKWHGSEFLWAYIFKNR